MKVRYRINEIVHDHQNIRYAIGSFSKLSEWLGIISITCLFISGVTLYGNPTCKVIFLDNSNNDSTSFVVAGQMAGEYHNYTQKHGWKANPDVVREHEERRPQFLGRKILWQESDVPDYELPNPLLRADGTTIGSVEHWQQHRAEILDIFRENMYGRSSGLPEKLTFNLIEEDISAMEGAATFRRVEIQSANGGRTHQFELILFLPNKIKGSVPVFLLMNNRDTSNTDPTRQEKSGFWPAEEVIERGYGISAIQNHELAPDNDKQFYEGVIRLFEGDDAAGERMPGAWGALAAWGWGASRVMDYFETDDRVDCSKVAVLGHSRGGKASLWVGAEDERFALVISNNSGCGGAALSKRRYGETVQAVNRFTHWFAHNFKRFNDQEDKLHFDQHMLVSLIAPRAVYVASADKDLWTDPRGEFLSLAHSSPVYSLWNYPSIDPDDMPPLDGNLLSGPRGYHIRSGIHNLTPEDWHYFMDFADRLWKYRPR
jgi:hypothetical protein